MYESFYGLRDKPFRLHPDPAFFFASKGHRRALAYLEYGLQQGEGFIVITGDVGAGKTTLLRTLIEQMPDGSVVVAQIVSTQVDADDLLRLVASAFAIPTTGHDKADILSRLEQFLLSLHQQGKRALLIVDEAQNLTQRAVEELRMLSNFQVGNAPLVQSFLVGQPEFRRIILSPEMHQLRQRVIASYHLGPLAADEVRRYIEHRLRYVGWNKRPIIEDDAYAAIFQQTEGVPRRINTLCDRLLLSGFLNESLTITAADVAEVGADMLNENPPYQASLASTPVARTPTAPIDDFMRLTPVAWGGIEGSLARISEQLESINMTTRLLYRSLKERSPGTVAPGQDGIPVE